MTTAAPETGLAEAERRLSRLRGQLEVEKSRHAATRDALERELEKATADRDLVLAGVPLAAVERAESLVYVKGREHALAGDGPSVIRQAIDDLASGCERLRREYLGTKSYDRWHGQAAGGPYGSGPSHGTKMLEVGLVPKYRRRRNYSTERGGSWLEPEQPTEAQVDAAVAYLHALLRGPAR